MDQHRSIYLELDYGVKYAKMIRHVLKPSFVDAFRVVTRYQQVLAYVVMDAVIETVVATMAVNCYYYFDYPAQE